MLCLLVAGHGTNYLYIPSPDGTSTQPWNLLAWAHQTPETPNCEDFKEGADEERTKNYLWAQEINYTSSTEELKDINTAFQCFWCLNKSETQGCSKYFQWSKGYCWGKSGPLGCWFANAGLLDVGLKEIIPLSQLGGEGRVIFKIYGYGIEKVDQEKTWKNSNWQSAWYHMVTSSQASITFKSLHHWERQICTGSTPPQCHWRRACTHRPPEGLRCFSASVLSRRGKDRSCLSLEGLAPGRGGGLGPWHRCLPDPPVIDSLVTRLGQPRAPGVLPSPRIRNCWVKVMIFWIKLCVVMRK